MSVIYKKITTKTKFTFGDHTMTVGEALRLACQSQEQMERRIGDFRGDQQTPIERAAGVLAAALLQVRKAARSKKPPKKHK